MATGYTADIAKGITFNQFALSCARAFGALIVMRDAPLGTEIPEKFKPDIAYYDEMLAKSATELNGLNAMTDAELVESCSDIWEENVKAYKKAVASNIELRNKYNAMLKRVIEWTPPSPDHEGLKDFMAKQIRESIKFDCDYMPKEPKIITPREYYTKRRDELLEKIKYYNEEKQKEIDLVNSRNEWIKQLRESLS